MGFPRSLEVWKMGTVNYMDALKLQDRLVSHRKSIPRSELETIGAELHYTQRGGDITFHGPHQAILYPIISLRDIGIGARMYVEKLESTMIELASLYGVKARAGRTGETGVWVGEKKIGAIGVRISSGITSHGLAFNIDPDLNYFKHIVPCGLSDKEVTSLRRETNLVLPAEEVIHDQLISSFARSFGFPSLIWKDDASVLLRNVKIK
ncbi:octanoyltransferase LIP2, mitochondrial-like isoform X2 [Malania oleifera]|uniref:octanoyltransferase LIP2, mitochondrial-like isoform X2 n=1 Tax=Malania oleifera TaxID=397392 RepID=UPI0025AEC637|nr:octanoyltransferase LIP2, mitochondrial-like isoform X2 [Malania oleifera]